MVITQGTMGPLIPYFGYLPYFSVHRPILNITWMQKYWRYGVIDEHFWKWSLLINPRLNTVLVKVLMEHFCRWARLCFWQVLLLFSRIVFVDLYFIFPPLLSLSVILFWYVLTLKNFDEWGSPLCYAMWSAPLNDCVGHFVKH